MYESSYNTDGIVARLNFICESWFGGSPTKFAGALGMSYANLQQYLNGRNVPGNKIQGRLRHIGIDPEWVLYGTGHMPYKLHPDMVKVLSTPEAVREIQFRVRESVPTSATEFAEPTDIYQPWVVEDFSPSDHILLDLSPAMAEGMTPVINPRDRVLIARRAEIKDGDLVAARWNDDEGVIRIYRRLGDLIQLWTLNPGLSPVTPAPKSLHLYKVVLIRKS